MNSWHGHKNRGDYFMTKFVQPPKAARWIIVLLAVLCLSNYGVAQQDLLDDTKDVIIDEPADKTEDVFDQTEDVFDDDDNDYDVDTDRDNDCVLDKDVDDDCDFDKDVDVDDDCDLDQDVDDDCDLDQDVDDCDLDQDVDDDCDLDQDVEDDCEVEEVEEIEMEKPTICEQTTAVKAPVTGPMAISLEELENNPESYYGQNVTVVGELHRIFTDKVFTIEDDGFFRDKDVLVINKGASCADIEACNDEFEPGKDLRITGLVVPYDRGKLECEHGPLNLESREGHSFTKNPVLIVGRPAPVAAAIIELEKPAPVPEPAPEPPALAPAPEPEPAPVEPEATPEPAPELPKTAGETPFLGLIGMLSLGAAFRLRRTAARRAE